MINVMQLTPGTRLRLVGDAVGEVVENMDDGMWVMVRYLKIANGNVGDEELCHAQDIIDVIPPGAEE